MVSNQQPYYTTQPQGAFYNSNQAPSGVYYQQQPLMYQPYQTYPITDPQNTVFIYDDVARRERNEAMENGLMAALCASCLCCWILPPLPLHCHFWGMSISWTKNITLFIFIIEGIIIARYSKNGDDHISVWVALVTKLMDILKNWSKMSRMEYKVSLASVDSN